MYAQDVPVWSGTTYIDRQGRRFDVELYVGIRDKYKRPLGATELQLTNRNTGAQRDYTAEEFYQLVKDGKLKRIFE